MPVLWFRACTWFQFWSKTFTKHCTNDYLLSCDKTISPLLELIAHVLSISQYVFRKTLIASDFNKKTYTKRWTSNYVISPCTLQLIRCSQFLSMIWKMEECRVCKDVALKNYDKNPDFDFVPLFFTLLT